MSTSFSGRGEEGRLAEGDWERIVGRETRFIYTPQKKGPTTKAMWKRGGGIGNSMQSITRGLTVS